MRALAAAVGIAVLAVIAITVFWPAARTGPAPIAYGRDTCDHCRMHLSQPGFAGELRDARGVLTKYDDVGCLLRAMAGMHTEVPEAWVEDHVSGAFMPLLSAVLVRVRPTDTPMGSGIVAFKDRDAAVAFARDERGAAVTLEDLLHDQTLLAQRGEATGAAASEVETR